MEYFDVVNENDEIIGKASRDEVHQKKLIMIQRSRNKKLNPLKWQGSASGHVESGESYELSAK